MSVLGKCLCGAVEFEVSLRGARFYRCYCSLCRKQSGTDSNFATIVPERRFRWRTGDEKIGSFSLKTGFRSNFCRNCGCPAPNQVRDTPYYWIPAGLLPDSVNLELVANVWVGSKAPWGPQPVSGTCYETVPELADFMRLLHPD